MPTQDIFFGDLTSVIYDGVRLTEVIFNGATVFTDPNPILGVGSDNAVSVGAGITPPTYSFSINWKMTATSQKLQEYTVIVRVYDSNGDVISGNDISHSFTTPYALSESAAVGTRQFSGSFGTLINTDTTNAFIQVTAGVIFDEDSLTVLSPTA